MLAGSAEGLLIARHDQITPTNSGITVLTSTYVTPYMKGTRVAAYPLDSVTDRSGNGNDLTNNGTTVFTGTSPLGVACAEFDGVDDSFSIALANSAEGNATYSLMFKTTSTSNPPAIEFLLNAFRTGFNDFLKMHLNTDGSLTLNFRDNSTATNNNTFSGDYYDGNWHHVAVVMDRTNGWVLFCLDGVIVADTSIVATNNLQFDQFSIGATAEAVPTDHFAGQISQVSVQTSAWTADEIRLEHSRMVAGLAGNTTLLTADDIDSVRVDLDTGYAIVTAGDTAHIMDAKTGIILETDAIGTGTLNDADIISMDGTDTPHYVLGGSTTIEQVAPNAKVY